jgi:hypothetical protein
MLKIDPKLDETALRELRKEHPWMFTVHDDKLTNPLAEIDDTDEAANGDDGQ